MAGQNSRILESPTTRLSPTQDCHGIKRCWKSQILSVGNTNLWLIVQASTFSKKKKKRLVLDYWLKMLTLSLATQLTVAVSDEAGRQTTWSQQRHMSLVISFIFLHWMESDEWCKSCCPAVAVFYVKKHSVTISKACDCFHKDLLITWSSLSR